MVFLFVRGDDHIEHMLILPVMQVSLNSYCPKYNIIIYKVKNWSITLHDCESLQVALTLNWHPLRLPETGYIVLEEGSVAIALYPIQHRAADGGGLHILIELSPKLHTGQE